MAHVILFSLDSDLSFVFTFVFESEMYWWTFLLFMINFDHAWTIIQSNQVPSDKNDSLLSFLKLWQTHFTSQAERRGQQLGLPSNSVPEEGQVISVEICGYVLLQFGHACPLYSSWYFKLIMQGSLPLAARAERMRECLQIIHQNHLVKISLFCDLW